MEPEAINILCANDKAFGRTRNSQPILCKLYSVSKLMINYSTVQPSRNE